MIYIDYEHNGWTLRYYLKAPHFSEYFHGQACWPMTSIFDRACSMCKTPMDEKTEKHFKAFRQLMKNIK